MPKRAGTAGASPAQQALQDIDAVRTMMRNVLGDDGVRYQVQIWRDGAWHPYREGRRFRSSAAAARLLDRVRVRFAARDTRVAIVNKEQAEA